MEPTTFVPIDWGTNSWNSRLSLNNVMLGSYIFLLTTGVWDSRSEIGSPSPLDPQTLDPQTLDPQTLDPQTLDPQTL